jgi:hypothetical protein
MKRVIWLMTFLAVSVNQVHVQEIGDPQNGLALARQVCSECHAIGRALARSPNSRSPTFSARVATWYRAGTGLLDGVEHVKQVARGARQAIEPCHHEHVAGTQPPQHLYQFDTIAMSTRHLLGIDTIATSRL